MTSSPFAFHEGIPGPLEPPPGWRDRVGPVCRSFYGTPWRDKGMVKGPNGGVDCCTFVIMVAAELGLIPLFVPPYYTQSMPLHEHGERYLNTIRAVCRPLAPGEERLPGDVLLFHIRGAASSGHAAIFLGGDRVAHADWRSGVMEDTMQRAILSRPTGTFRPRGA